MKIQHFIPLFLLMSVLLAACASPTLQPQLPSDEPPSETPAPPLSDETVVLSWQRNGGIAGFCDRLTVLVSGAYTVENCKTKPSVRSGQLDAAQLNQLTAWVKSFQSFKDGDDDTTAAYPDQMFVKTVFTGTGSAPASVEEIGQISNFAAALAAPKPVDDTPEVAIKARDFLAARLGVGADAVKIVSIEAVDWPDACLGLAQADRMCAQVITPGYKVVLEAGGKSYELRIGERADSFLVVP